MTAASHSCLRAASPGPVLARGSAVAGRGQLGLQRPQSLPGVGDQGHGPHLVGVHRADVEPDEGDVRVLERGLRGRDEVAHPGPDADHDVGLADQPVGGQAAVRAGRTHAHRVVPGQGALARLGLDDRDPEAAGERGQVVGRLGVDRAAAGHDDRRRRRPDQAHRVGQVGGLGQRPADAPDARLEEAQGKVERLGLDVLGQRDRDRAGVDRIGQDPERTDERREQLLRTGDPVEVARDRPKRVVHAEVALDRVLDLLENGIRGPVREVVARQEQDRDPVDRGGGRPGDHVEGAGTDRRGTGKGPEPVALLGEGGRDMDLGLLVLGPVVRHLERAAELLEGLAQPGHVAMPEDAPETCDEPVLPTIPLDLLGGTEADDCLSHRQPDSVHRSLLAQPIATKVSSRRAPRQYRSEVGG